MRVRPGTPISNFECRTGDVPPPHSKLEIRHSPFPRLSRCKSFASLRAKERVHGASPCESTNFICQKQIDAKGEPACAIRALPVLVDFSQGRDVTVSISACDADCAGANPVALTSPCRTEPQIINTRNIPMNITELVKNKKARFLHYREGHFIYMTDDGFQFPIPLADIGNATLQAEDKALFFMRWIRSQLEVIKTSETCQS